MAYEHKEGQGFLFRNEKQNDRQPDYRGTILIGGVTYRVVAWEKTSQNGTKFMSLQAEPQQEVQSQSQRQEQLKDTNRNLLDLTHDGSAVEEDMPF